MKLLVCGGRTYEDKDRLFDILDAMHLARPISMIIHGDAGKFYDYPDNIAVEPGMLCGFWVGADKLAGQWAREHGVTEKFYKPEWSKYGKKAGPMRNQQMLDFEVPDFVVAFSGGRGTKDMVKRAREGGYRVYEVGEN
jgi:hypothetical protein